MALLVSSILVPLILVALVVVALKQCCFCFCCCHCFCCCRCVCFCAIISSFALNLLTDPLQNHHSSLWFRMILIHWIRMYLLSRIQHGLLLCNRSHYEKTVITNSKQDTAICDTGHSGGSTTNLKGIMTTSGGHDKKSIVTNSKQDTAICDAGHSGGSTNSKGESLRQEPWLKTEVKEMTRKASLRIWNRTPPSVTQGTVGEVPTLKGEWWRVPLYYMMVAPWSREKCY